MSSRDLPPHGELQQIVLLGNPSIGQNPLFGSAVVLFDKVVQILARFALLPGAEVPRSPPSPARPMRRSIVIQCHLGSRFAGPTRIRVVECYEYNHRDSLPGSHGRLVSKFNIPTPHRSVIGIPPWRHTGRLLGGRFGKFLWQAERSHRAGHPGTLYVPSAQRGENPPYNGGSLCPARPLRGSWTIAKPLPEESASPAPSESTLPGGAEKAAQRESEVISQARSNGLSWTQAAELSMELWGTPPDPSANSLLARKP